MNRLPLSARLALPGLLGLLATSASALAQDNPFSWPGITLPSGDRFEFRLHFPRGITVDTPRPIALGFVDGKQDRGPVYDTMNQFFWMQVPKEGVGIVLPVAKKGTQFHDKGGLDGVRHLVRSLRGQTRIQDNGLHAIGFGEAGTKSALAAVKAWPDEFRSLTIVTSGTDGELPAALPNEARYRHVRLVVLAPAVDDKAPAAWAERIALWTKQERKAEWRRYDEPGADPLWAALRDHVKVEVPEKEAAIHQCLDQFHSAAARVDAARYFSLWHEDGKFQAPGEDKPWDVATLRINVQATFARPPGFILVPSHRTVKLAEDGKSAQVEESLGSVQFASSAVGRSELVLVDDKWRVRSYELSGPPKGALLAPRRE